jgi:MFS family permease
MSPRAARLIAWTLSVLAIALAVSGLVFAHFNDLTERVLQGSSMVDVVFALSTPLGALIASLRPRNPIGWLFCALGIDSGITVFALEYGSYGLEARPGALPAAEFVYWVGSWVGVLGFLFGVFLFLLFPSGIFLSRSWKGVAWVATGVTFIAAITDAVSPWPTHPSLDFGNPLALEASPGPIAAVRGVAFTALILCLTASAAALVMRLRRSRGHERQQLKWFTYAAIVAALVSVFAPLHVPTWEILAPLTYALLPIATAIAILRHRLYDIDVLIHRTLVYSALTAILGAVYFALVLMLQFVFNPLASQSDLAIAGSTLAVAALFRPARTRIQRFIDRRFYRARYDATRTIEKFSERLTERIDLETLNAELVGVVQETLQPEHVVLWLRPRAPENS